MRNLLRNERGFTLLEVLIASFMSLLVSGAALHFYLSQHESWLVQNEVADIQQSARSCLDEIASEMRMAGYGLTSHPYYETGQDSLTIYYVRNAAVDTSRYFVATSDSKDQYLYRQHNGQAPEAYADGIEKLTVTRLSASLFELGVTARGRYHDQGMRGEDGYRRRTFTTRVRIRNTGF